MKRLKEMKKNQKGFTHVELIVVLVILAILAAMLVPALLGYIDRARQGKYNEEFHSIYTALQVINDERYAAGSTTPLSATKPLTDTELTEVNNMIAPTNIAAAADVTPAYDTASTAKHAEWAINGLTKCKFTSQDGKTVEGTMTSGSVTITNTP